MMMKLKLNISRPANKKNVWSAVKKLLTVELESSKVVIQEVKLFIPVLHHHVTMVVESLKSVVVEVVE